MTKVPISLQKEAEEEGWDALHPLKEVSTKGRSEKMRQASLLKKSQMLIEMINQSLKPQKSKNVK